MKKEIVRSYLETVLLTSTLSCEIEYEGEVYDESDVLIEFLGVDDIPDEVFKAAEWDLLEFREYSEDTLGFNPFDVFDDTRVAHDFALSRNGHGAGFFDDSYVHNGVEYNQKLQEAAKTFGNFDLDVYTVNEDGFDDLVIKVIN